MRSAVIVPAYERPEALRRSVEALARLDPAPDEIVVVDDGSREPLAPVCEGVPRLRCIRQANAGPAAARNAGARASDADLLAFTDDDCRPRPGWLGALMAAHGGVEGRLVGGIVREVAGGVYAAASHTMGEHLNAAFDAVGGGAEFFASNNLACSRARYEALGGFDEAFPLAAGEDRDFGRRWRAAGGELVLAPDAVVDHAHPMGLRGFWRQHSNYGRGACLVRARASARGGAEKAGFGRPRFYAALLARPFHDRQPRPVARAALLLLSQVATAQGYALQRRATRRP